MKYLHALIILTLSVAAPAHSQSDLRFDPKPSENIEAERAKAVAEQAKSDNLPCRFGARTRITR
jgi:hypothetical protein